MMASPCRPPQLPTVAAAQPIWTASYSTPPRVIPLLSPTNPATEPRLRATIPVSTSKSHRRTPTSPWGIPPQTPTRTLPRHLWIPVQSRLLTLPSPPKVSPHPSLPPLIPSLAPPTSAPRPAGARPCLPSAGGAHGSMRLMGARRKSPPSLRSPAPVLSIRSTTHAVCRRLARRNGLTQPLITGITSTNLRTQSDVATAAKIFPKLQPHLLLVLVCPPSKVTINLIIPIIPPVSFQTILHRILSIVLLPLPFMLHSMPAGSLRPPLLVVLERPGSIGGRVKAVVKANTSTTILTQFLAVRFFIAHPRYRSTILVCSNCRPVTRPTWPV